LVIIAWKKLYERWPTWREAVCIFFHDIGHIGLNYLDDFEQKKTHWKLGARICWRLFGDWGYWMVAGHCKYSNCMKSLLWKPDKYSYVIAPVWWEYWNALVEPKLRGDDSIREHVRKFRENVAQNYKRGYELDTHEIHLKMSNEKKQ
jgi:hypothetical protein